MVETLKWILVGILVCCAYIFGVFSGVHGESGDLFRKKEVKECVVTKCDLGGICEGDTVEIVEGVYRGNTAKVTDVTTNYRLWVAFCDREIEDYRNYYRLGMIYVRKVGEKKEEKSFKVGDRYFMNTKDPFQRGIKVEILEIKEGYIKYKYLSTGGTSSWDIESFKRIYRHKI